MANLPSYVDFADLPDTLPVFPLRDVLLLPGGLLPLNIFEPRYIAMIDDALKSHRLIGMIQPQQKNDKNFGPEPLQRVGCVGKIIQFSETPDGRYLVTLAGQYRFTVAEEYPARNGYRAIRPDWTEYSADLDVPDCLDLDREKLRNLTRSFLAKHDVHIDCKQLDGASDAKLINALSMICPFESLDKQALLEAPCARTRAQMFMAMLEIATHDCDCGARH